MITGVSRGIGKALAQKFLEEGYFVIGTSTSGTVDFSHEHLTVFQLELTSEESIKICVEHIHSLEQRIDILFNNAGITTYDEDNALRIDPSILRKAFEINLFGPIQLTQSLLTVIQDGSHIINLTSRYGSLNYIWGPDAPSYRMSKAALNMYTRVMALALKDRGITVSCVHPGWVKTDMGGPNAQMEPTEAVEHLFALAISKPESGQFWFKGEHFPW